MALLSQSFAEHPQQNPSPADQTAYTLAELYTIFFYELDPQIIRARQSENSRIRKRICQTFLMASAGLSFAKQPEIWIDSFEHFHPTPTLLAWINSDMTKGPWGIAAISVTTFVVGTLSYICLIESLDLFAPSQHVLIESRLWSEMRKLRKLGHIWSYRDNIKKQFQDIFFPGISLQLSELEKASGRVFDKPLAPSVVEEVELALKIRELAHPSVFKYSPTWRDNLKKHQYGKKLSATMEATRLDEIFIRTWLRMMYEELHLGPAPSADDIIKKIEQL